MTEIYEKAVGVRFFLFIKAYLFYAHFYVLVLVVFVFVESVRGVQIW